MIRLARPSDLAAVRSIESSVAAMARGTIMDFPANTAANARGDLMTAVERQLMWVAEWASDGAVDVAGFLFAEPSISGLYLRELAVATIAQRHGIGKALMLAGIAAARDRGDAQVLLTTQRNLPWNAPFYARLGFEIIEDEAIPPDVHRRLRGQFAAGFDAATRCAMILRLA
jgi:GNAT superfamily N-acetyltransferase